MRMSIKDRKHNMTVPSRVTYLEYDTKDLQNELLKTKEQLVTISKAHVILQEQFLRVTQLINNLTTKDNENVR